MQDSLRLPKDYHKDEVVLKQTLEDFLQQELMASQSSAGKGGTEMIRNSQLNSMLGYDAVTQKSSCPNS